MTTKKMTKFTINILVISISALFAVHYLGSSPPALTSPRHNKVVSVQATLQKQALQQKQEVAPYLSNDHIAIFIVAPLVTLAMIVGLIIIYQQELEAGKGRERHPLRVAVASNKETTANLNKVAYNSPLSTSSHYESQDTTEDSDYNAQNASNNHDTDNSNATSMPQYTRDTTGAGPSSHLPHKDIYRYSQDIQRGGIQEHHWHTPTPAVKVYGANPTQPLTASGGGSIEINSDRNSKPDLKAPLNEQHSHMRSPVNNYDQKQEETDNAHMSSSTDDLSEHNGHSDQKQEETDIDDNFQNITINHNNTLQQHQDHTLSTTMHHTHKPNELTIQSSYEEKEEEEPLSNHQQPRKPLDEIDVSSPEYESDSQTGPQTNIPSLYLETTQDKADDLLSAQEIKKMEPQQKEDFEQTLSLLKRMLQAQKPKMQVTDTHKDNFQLLSLATGDLAAQQKYNIPDEMLKKWNKFRKGKKSKLKFNMQDMYNFYHNFIPELVLSDKNAPELKNMLLFDKIVKIFPNAKKITCEHIDHLENNTNQQAVAFPTTIGSGFIKRLHTMLSKMSLSDEASLEKITISSTNYYISDACCENMAGFNELGWFLVKYPKKMILTKKPDKYIRPIREKIKLMIQGKELKTQSQLFPSEILIFEQIASPALEKSPLSSQRQNWVKFTEQQKKLIIDMHYMYSDYQKFTALIRSKDVKFTLQGLFNKLLAIFPQTRVLECRNIDCTEFDNYTFQSSYTRDIVTQGLIKYFVSNLNPHNKNNWDKLEKITLIAEKYEIDEQIDFKVIKFGEYGWYIRKATYDKDDTEIKNNQLTLIKETGNQDKIWQVIVKEGLIPKISYLMGLKRTDESNLTSLSCVPLFTQLISPDGNDLSLYITEAWDKFRHNEKTITIHLRLALLYNEAFIPLLFTKAAKDKERNKKDMRLWLLFDKVAALFPNATKIVSTGNDCIGFSYYGSDKSFYQGLYVPEGLAPDFILYVKKMLIQIDEQGKNKKLKEIVLTNAQASINDHNDIYVEEFSKLRWKIHIGPVGRQIILTKAGDKEDEKSIWADIIKKGVIPKISYIIGLAPSIIDQASSIINQTSPQRSNLTTGAVISILNKLLAPNADKLLPHAVEAWNKFTQKRNKLTFDMEKIDIYYKRLNALFVSDENLPRLDTIMKTFPNVKTITCSHVDYRRLNEKQKKPYANIIAPNFMLKLDKELSKIAPYHQSSKLEKIIFEAETTDLKGIAETYGLAFKRGQGWQIKTEKNNTKITLKKKKKFQYPQNNDDEKQADNQSNLDTDTDIEKEQML